MAAVTSSSSPHLLFVRNKPSLPSFPWKLLSLPHSCHQSQPNTKPLFVDTTAMDSKPAVLLAEKLCDVGLDLLRTFANVDCSYDLNSEEICTKISLWNALIVRSGTKVSCEVFEQSVGRLKVVGRAGVGIDNVDLSAATEHDCLVVNAPMANTIDVAEHGIALLTTMGRNIAPAHASVKSCLCFFAFWIWLGFIRFSLGISSTS